MPIAGLPPRFVTPGRLALAAILALAALLRLWQLGQNGFGRQYYAAGVRSMVGSWHNFLFNAFDPAGFVSLDKPPVAIWMQVAGAKILGFSAFAVMLPQVLEGLAAVALVHHLVTRRFGRTAGLLAALFLALTPISVAIDRSNNTDSCLVLVLLLAAWALLRAAETGRLALLVLALALVGIGFNVKMAAALVVAPTFCLVYLCSAPGLSLRRRLGHLAIATAVMVGVSLSWVTAFDLTPADQRPYAGSTGNNSMLELALLHNGLNRFLPAAPAPPPNATPAPTAKALWDRTPVGPLRLLTPHLAGQMAWWLPLAIAGAVLGAQGWRRRRRLTPEQASVLLWAGWTLTYAAAFSLAGGVFHTYYVAVLGPPLAALAGIGAAALWQRREQASMHFALPGVLLATAAWHAFIDQGNGWQLEGWRGALLAAVVGGLVIAAGILFARQQQAQARSAAALAIVAMLAMPLAWALSTVLVRPNVAAPAADISMLSTLPVQEAASRPRSRKLLDFLRANRDSERFLLAVPNAMQAAPWIVFADEPVMAMGGYLGRDPILTPAALERMVRDGELRYVMTGGPSLVPADLNERTLAQWVVAHGRRVDPALWRDAPDPARVAAAVPASAPRMRAPARLYDMRPDLADLWPAGAAQ